MRSALTFWGCFLVLAFVTPASSALLGLFPTMEGIVQKVNGDSLAIESLEGDVKQTIVLQVNKETEFEGAVSLENLQPGDQVKVKYQKEGNAKIAVSVAKVVVKEAIPDPEALKQL